MIGSIVLSICMLSMTAFAQWAIKAPYLSDRVDSLLFYLLNIKVAFFYLLPAAARALDISYLKDLNINSELIFSVYILEFCYHTVWLFSFLFFVFLIGGIQNLHLNLNKFFYMLFLFSLVIFVATRFELFQLPGILIALYGPFGFEFLKAACLMSIFYPHQRFKKTYLLIGILSLVFVILSISTRASLFYLILLAIYFVGVWHRRYFARVIFVVAPLVIFLSLSASATIPALRIDDQGQLKISTTILEEKRMGRSPIEEIFWRFGALSRLSTGFLKMHERGELAGWKPVINSASGFLPRSLNPDKPHPSTLDGKDIYSQGMYLTSREMTGTKTNMVEFSVGAQSYWEHGLLGVFGYSILSALCVLLLTRYYSKYGTLTSLTLLLVLSKPFGFVEPKIWISEIILHFYKIFIPVLTLFILFNVVSKFTKRQLR